jgi:hypothetical protein
LLFYDRPGDHIGWHYDRNFSRGLHFMVLIGLTNEGRAADGLSHAKLQARVAGREIAVSTAPNTDVVFEGSRLRHRVTSILVGERRLVLSMTYCRVYRAGSRTQPSSTSGRCGMRDAFVHRSPLK